MNKINELPNNTNAQLEMMAMVADIVAAYVSNHTVERDQLPGLVKQVQGSLRGTTIKNAALLPIPGEPAVPLEESITPEYIICLEDGKRMKMLKRHLRTTYGLTPEQYRERWNLPADYPLVAPNYAKKRQDIANSIGLGKTRLKHKKAA